MWCTFMKIMVREYVAYEMVIWAYSSLHSSGVVHRYQSGWTSKLWLGALIELIHYIGVIIIVLLLVHWLNKLSSCLICFCNSALITYYLLRELGWALTEYGDNLQSLVATKLENKFFQCSLHSSVRDIVSIHYITLHYSALHCIALHRNASHHITLRRLFNLFIYFVNIQLSKCKLSSIAGFNMIYIFVST